MDATSLVNDPNESPELHPGQQTRSFPQNPLVQWLFHRLNFLSVVLDTQLVLLQ